MANFVFLITNLRYLWNDNDLKVNLKIVSNMN